MGRIARRLTLLVAYYRVSTLRQGQSGLGLDAQRAAVKQYARVTGGKIVAEFTEIESGRDCSRPQLQAAFALARDRAAIVVVAKLDRLSRDVRFALELADRGIPFVCLDVPDINTRTAAGRMIFVSLANLAEFESRRIGERIREALARRKKKPKSKPFTRAHQRRAAAAWHAANRRKAIAFRAEYRPLALGLRQTMTLAQVAAELNARNIPTRRRRKWTAGLVHALLRRG